MATKPRPQAIVTFQDSKKLTAASAHADSAYKGKGSSHDGWTQLITAMDRIGAIATANGLTDAKLDELLADES